MKLDRKRAWVLEARRCPSPNCDERPNSCGIDLVVVHGISLPPGEFGTPHVEALFCNRLDPTLHPYFAEICHLEVSAHLLIRRDGELVQFVPLTHRAWHAGESVFCGRSQCNDFSIGIELEGVDDVFYEDAQYQRLISVLRLLMKTWPEITPDRIVGHSDIAPGRKTDPGTAFDWDRVRGALV
ncbi:MAG: 1,6-anhydro-N-acetylmuramyl-L-alanine amidase AmpD [Gammaproteobacteria bacterium]|nr:1,6-anhydro-N-acetylmuramyl-L-alanine amidase AmpD [Gammaproteobacteria bacterium]